MWRLLKVSPGELRLDFTLPTGQCFRWRRRPDGSYIGVVRDRVFHLKQTSHEDDLHYRRLNVIHPVVEEEDRCLLQERFSLDECSLSVLSKEWTENDVRFGRVYPYLKGARVLRQDPLECLFQFLCSSNNHIGRIQGMVESLCQMYGSLLLSVDHLPQQTNEEQQEADPHSLNGHIEAAQTPERDFYAFPTLNQLEDACEEDLRRRGFGYRAKYIEGSLHCLVTSALWALSLLDCVQVLLRKEDGGEKWLQSLRSATYEEAVRQLCQLPGVGPKVAACVCLFSLDKHHAVPIDTHVHQLATKYYLYDPSQGIMSKEDSNGFLVCSPELKGKSLTKKVMKSIEGRMRELFGDYAGWAHNVLFVAELASHQTYLPIEERTQKTTKKRRRPDRQSN